MAYIMVPMTALEFRTRYESAFTINPEMTIDEFHAILLSHDWNEEAALLQVKKMLPRTNLERDSSREDDSESPEEFFQPVERQGLGSENVSEKRVVKPKNLPAAPTTVTKWIGRLAGGLFLRTLLVCDVEKALKDGDCLEAIAEQENVSMDALIDLTVDRETIRRAGWTGRDVTLDVNLVDPVSWHEEEEDQIGFASALIDGVTFRPGDFVTVRPGDDYHPHAKVPRKGQETRVAAGIWFARIQYFFESAEGPCAHLHWLIHGGDTILGETAGPRELFVMHRCDDAPLSSISGLVKVDFVPSYAQRQDSREVVELRYHDVNHYFYRLAYSEVDECFEESQDLDRFLLTGQKYCGCCERLSDLESDTQVRSWKSNGVVQSVKHQGVLYRVDDFVYLTPKDYGEPYTIAQITGFRSGGLRNWIKTSSAETAADIKVSVQLYHRHADLVQPYFEEYKRGFDHTIRDCRRLYRDTYQFLSVTLDRLDGKCFVRHVNCIENLNAFKNMDDTFYVADHVTDIASSSARSGGRRLADLQDLLPQELVPSETNDLDYGIELSRFKHFLSQNRKLKAMEVFSGAGGLAVGLDESDAIVTTWAIEHDTLAAQTFKRNFPSANVYNHDANILLRQAIEEHSGTSKGPLEDLLGFPMPRMPWPGEVDFLYGGPPCQDFSKCNRYQKANSIKNSLLTTYLSYVDHYRPKYVLLENVQELLSHRLGSSQVDIHNTKGGIEMGSAKFILRALTSLGYQAQFSVLQAAEYGTPQSRTRVFFWGALFGYALPKYPEPTHIFPAGKAPKYSRRTRRSAPHRTVTVGDAISDLPAFDWHMDIPGESPSDRLSRIGRSVSQVAVEAEKPGVGPTIQGYNQILPYSEYQRHARRNADQHKVYNHYTCRWIDSTMHRILKIPLEPGANHLDLPPEEDLRCLRADDSAAPRHAFYRDRYRRLDYEQTFQTCLTKIDPSGKNGSVLHPTQKRVITVREQARAMGFPDSFTWDERVMTPKDMYKQIGNAVAIPVGRALGKELLKVLVQKWEKEMEWEELEALTRPPDMNRKEDGNLHDSNVKRESDENMEQRPSKRSRPTGPTRESENDDRNINLD